MPATQQRRRPAPPPRGRRRSGVQRLLRWAGLLLLVAGLAVLGYVAWQMVGTNVVSKHRAEDLRQETRQAWRQGDEGPAGAILRVPRFGKQYAVPIIKGFDEQTLAKGIAWYPDGAGPGQKGNYVLAAHRITHGEPFAKFPSLRKGDLVYVDTRTATYTYRLRESGTRTVVDFRTDWPLFPVPQPGGRGMPGTKPVITLLTCSELFHTDNRSVVVGDLVRTTPPVLR